MTSTQSTVLIVTNERDVSADWVVRELRRRDSSYLRLNTERLPSASVSWIDGVWRILRHDGRYAELGEETSVWYRRPEPPRSPQIDSLTMAELTMVRAQWRALVQGICATRDSLIINDPWANDRAESKIWQLEMARAVGFQVPATLVSNDRGHMLEQFDAWSGAIVVKGLDAPLIEEPEPRFVFSQTISRATLEQANERESAPLVLQRRVGDKIDVRVTVVGDRIFAASTIVPASQVDWRASTIMPPFERHVLDSRTEQHCRDLVKSLGLVFGAIDLALNSEGYWFLEINPNGEWGWLQQTVGLPIAETIVDHLTRHQS